MPRTKTKQTKHNTKPQKQTSVRSSLPFLAMAGIGIHTHFFKNDAGWPKGKEASDGKGPRDHKKKKNKTRAFLKTSEESLDFRQNQIHFANVPWFLGAKASAQNAFDFSPSILPMRGRLVQSSNRSSSTSGSSTMCLLGKLRAESKLLDRLVNSEPLKFYMAGRVSVMFAVFFLLFLIFAPCLFGGPYVATQKPQQA